MIFQKNRDFYSSIRNLAYTFPAMTDQRIYVSYVYLLYTHEHTMTRARIEWDEGGNRH